MASKFSLIIDFDSTIISLETLEYLASISLYNNNQKNEIIKKISHYTNLAMNGEITFEESLDIRFFLYKLIVFHNKCYLKIITEYLLNTLKQVFI